MRAWPLTVIILLLRYGLMAAIRTGALARAVQTPAETDGQRLLFTLHALSETSTLLFICFQPFRPDTLLFAGGLLLFLAGSVLYALAVVSFAREPSHTFCHTGVYAFSRHPMYLGFFICLLSAAALTASLTVLIMTAAHQIITHAVILAEEQTCLRRFGQRYRQYQARVRMYF